MGKQMLINAVHAEQKRMAIVDDGKLLDYNIQMAVKEPITGNIYKGVVMKVERGLQAAFVNYGGKKDGFLPLRDVSQDYFTERRDGDNGPEGGHGHGRPFLKVGQEVIVQVIREVSERKGALLTTFISLPGRYIVLMPNKQGSGISRKIEDEDDRKRLKEIMGQIKLEDGMGFIIRTAGMNRTKQELARDYQHLSRLWKEIQKAAKSTPAPAVIYQESDFGVCSLRDYFTSEIEEILVDDTDTFRKMRAYCKTVSPRTVKIIKLYKDMVPLFDKYNLEDQIRVIYQERVDLKSGGYLIINPTEAMITIDVNSGRGSNKRNVEETAYRTNLEAAEEIARQLRLRDLGGLIVIDFIDMVDRQHQLEIERAFKKALSVDRSRIQMSKISKFGMLELSRQKKQSTIQEISYTACPYCKGTGFRPSLEYIALSAFRKIESQAVKRTYAKLKVALPHAVSDYLLNQKRLEISRLESMCDMSIHISGHVDMQWDEVRMEYETRETLPESMTEKEKDGEPVKEQQHRAAAKIREREAARADREGVPEKEAEAITVAATPEGAGLQVETPRKKSRRRSRHRRKKAAAEAETTVAVAIPPEVNNDPAAFPAPDLIDSGGAPALDDVTEGKPDVKDKGDRPDAGQEVLDYGMAVPADVSATENAGSFVAGPGTGGGRKGNKTAEAKQEGALPRVEKPRAGKGKDIVSAGPEETSSSQGLPSREVPVDETPEVATETVKTPRRKRRAPGRSTQRRRKTANQSVPPDGDGEAPPETLP
ncbi:MAG TPA: Rne/Rng family ribonuclease [Syntrophales bacterium]|mgnify:FL=1|jgi:ribonuclease E|nr:Rne/Rng family ribonuclease [Syntrophales bacterium]